MKELKSREGYYLTQANEVEDRIFITAIKGENVRESDWREATQAEKDEYDKAQEEKAEKSED